MVTTTTEVCCPKFDPQPWNEQDIIWQDKKFVADRVRSLFHIPLNFKSVMVRNVELIENAGAKPENMIVLADENSLWGADVYIEASKDVPGAAMSSISGTFMSKVFEGHYKNVPTWMKQMKEHVRSAGREMKKLYCYYTTCPRCAKKYGKNYVVLLAEV